MKTALLNSSLRASYALTFLLFLLSLTASSQSPTHTGKFSPEIDANINGFWEYLPRDYSADINQDYPLIIFLHGAGEQGSTPDLTTLSRVLNHGIPRLIENNEFPESVTSGGNSFRFIVLSPQIKNGFDGATRSSTVQPATINALIDYAIATYRVDQSRIYLAGLSMGGGTVWDYIGSTPANAERIGAVAIACGAGDVTISEAQNITAGNIPVMATHNTVDNVISSSRTVANVTNIQDYSPAGNVAPRAVLWESPGTNGAHDAWNRTFNQLIPGSTPGGNLVDTIGINVYQWLLQYITNVGSLPVTWVSFTATKSGAVVNLSWEVSDEINVKFYEVERSSDNRNWISIARAAPLPSNESIKKYFATDRSPLRGLNYYRIREIDGDDKTAYSSIRSVNNQLTAASINIYPVPFLNELNIQVQNSTPLMQSIALYDLMGKLVKNIHFQPSNSIRLPNLASLPKGIYVLRVNGTDGSLLFEEKIVR